MMSAPSAIMRRAWAMALAGSRNWPPAENEAGVRWRTPRTRGWRSPKSRASQEGRVSPGRYTDPGSLTVTMRSLCARGHAVSSHPEGRPSVGDLERQLLGVLDPAHHRLLGWHQPHQLAARIGVGHRFGEVGGVAVLELLHGVDPRRLEQLGIVLADALDAHAVGHVGPAQDAFRVDAGLGGEALATLRVLRSLEQPGRRADADGLQHCGHARSDILEICDRVGHKAAPQMNW